MARSSIGLNAIVRLSRIRAEAVIITPIVYIAVTFS